MTNRRKNKKEHERFHIENFLEWFNKTYKSDFKVISEPEPPEAIIKSEKTVRWVEISTAFWNSDYAKDLNSYAASNESHIPIRKGPHMNMDSEFSKNFVTVLVKKLEKNSYLNVKEKYGKGYLIIPIYFPFFDTETIKLMKDEWSRRECTNLNCFRSVRICYKKLNKWVYYRWPNTSVH